MHMDKLDLTKAHIFQLCSHISIFSVVIRRDYEITRSSCLGSR
jgi:hypothetical protein